MNLFRRIADYLAGFMSGRYGGRDNLNIALLGFALLLMLINAFAKSAGLTLFTAAVLGYHLFRSLSRNFPARQKENSVFTQAVLKVYRWCRHTVRHILGDSNYKYYTCPQCRKELRVPRKKGNIEITCPQCGRSFRART